MAMSYPKADELPQAVLKVVESLKKLDAPILQSMQGRNLRDQDLELLQAFLSCRGVALQLQQNVEALLKKLPQS